MPEPTAVAQHLPTADELHRKQVEQEAEQQRRQKEQAERDEVQRRLAAYETKIQRAMTDIRRLRRAVTTFPKPETPRGAPASVMQQYHQSLYNYIVNIMLLRDGAAVGVYFARKIWHRQQLQFNKHLAQLEVWQREHPTLMTMEVVREGLNFLKEINTAADEMLQTDGLLHAWMDP